ncbi:hypothetical protein CS063_13700 [Sporanaerobium hydrogeniformans]|uniref:Uncharacterized protein n=1 Tax=Sporanaerobium hydrogeniformans TaxID=3072179 RepID=A0AC61D9N1_9FIRM|nr:sigma factor-like helix-turn-helix DNA-binding protein [Sporanaerobium hydrogeniformans]PHV69768.1 hypothetical protein CS063_13700 [Sporanaerobium hydrogeniformans]
MDIIKTLKDIKYIKMEADYTKDKLEEIRERRKSIKSSSNSNIAPGSHVSTPNSSMIDSIVSIEELEKMLDAKLSHMYKLENEVVEKLEVLEPKERVVIKLHYFEGETLEHICGVIKYSWRHTMRIYKGAMEKLKKMA